MRKTVSRGYFSRESRFTHTFLNSFSRPDAIGTHCLTSKRCVDLHCKHLKANKKARSAWIKDQKNKLGLKLASAEAQSYASVDAELSLDSPDSPTSSEGYSTDQTDESHNSSLMSTPSPYNPYIGLQDQAFTPANQQFDSSFRFDDMSQYLTSQLEELGGHLTGLGIGPDQIDSPTSFEDYMLPSLPQKGAEAMYSSPVLPLDALLPTEYGYTGTFDCNTLDPRLLNMDQNNFDPAQAYEPLGIPGVSSYGNPDTYPTDWPTYA